MIPHLPHLLDCRQKLPVDKKRNLVVVVWEAKREHFNNIDKWKGLLKE